MVEAVLGSVASGLVGKVFGSDGKEVQQTQASTAPTFPKYIPPELQNLVEKTRTLIDKPYEAYTGDRTAGLAADETEAFNLIRGLQGQYQAGLGQAQNLTNEVAQRGLGGFTQAQLNQYMNPYQTNVMDISRDRQFDAFERQKQALQQQQGAIGAFGGSRSALAQGQLYDNFARQLAEQEANQLYQGFEGAQNRAMAGTVLAGQQAGNLANYGLQGQQAGLQGASALQQVGGIQRGLSQADLDVNYQDFLTKQEYPYKQIQFGQSVIDPIARTTSGNTSSSTGSGYNTGGPGLLGQAVGIGALAQGTGAAQGLSGYFGNLMGGKNAIFNPITYSGVNNDLNSLFSSSPNLFKDGGQVRNKMKYEENDLAQNLGSFYDMLVEGSRDTQYPDEDLDQPVHPGGPTRRQLLQLWEQQQSIGGFNDTYKCGGMVKGYAEGGKVGWWDSIAQMYSKPAADWQFDSAPARIANAEMNPLERAYNRFQSTGGLAGLAVPSAGSKQADAVLSQIYGDDDPMLASQRAIRERTAGNPEFQRNAGVPRTAPPDISGVLANEQPQGISRGQAAASLLRGPYRGLAQMFTGDSNSAQTARPEQGLSQVDAEPYPRGMQSFPIAAAIEAPKEEPKKEEPKKTEMNIPLIQFGAAMLGSKNSFFKALGEASSVYGKEVKDRETRVKEEAANALKLLMEERRLKAYERQVDLSANPEMQQLKLETARAKLDQIKNKLSTDPLYATKYKAIMGTGRYSPEEADVLAGGGNSTPSNIDVIDFSSLPD